MKKSRIFIISIVLSFLIALNCSGAIPENRNVYVRPVLEGLFHADYDCAEWGMSREQLRSCISKTETHQGEGYLWCTGTFAGEDVDMIFDFIDDKLSSVHVRVKAGSIINQAYVFKFFKFENLLIGKYGEPLRKIRKGSPDPYISDADAIFMGIGKYSSFWLTADSEITLLLHGYDYEMHLWIEYASVKLANQKEQGNK